MKNLIFILLFIFTGCVVEYNIQQEVYYRDNEIIVITKVFTGKSELVYSSTVEGKEEDKKELRDKELEKAKVLTGIQSIVLH